jgi:hypothetical protein
MQLKRFKQGIIRTTVVRYTIYDLAANYDVVDLTSFHDSIKPDNALGPASLPN